MTIELAIGLAHTALVCKEVRNSEFWMSYPTLLKTVERPWRLVQTKELSHCNTANTHSYLERLILYHSVRQENHTQTGYKTCPSDKGARDEISLKTLDLSTLDLLHLRADEHVEETLFALFYTRSCEKVRTSVYIVHSLLRNMFLSIFKSFLMNNEVI